MRQLNFAKNTLTNNMEYLYTKLNELELQEIYKYVMTTNKSKYLPYHNNFHLEQVCKYALLNSEYENISIEEQKLLAIAALFHDYNHSGSGKNDDDNIREAVSGFLDYQYNSKNELKSEEKLVVWKAIKSTRYPYLTEGTELPLLDKILRDADILQSLFCQNYINGVVGAIATESNMTIEVMLKVQIQFLENTKFLTNFATINVNKQLPRITELINITNNLYESK